MVRLIDLREVVSCALHTRMTRASALGFAAILATAGIETTASAQEKRGFTVNRFEPADRGSEWYGSESLDYRGRVRGAIGVVGDYSYRSFLVFQPDGDVRGSVVRNAFYVHPGGSLTLVDRL